MADNDDIPFNRNFPLRPGVVDEVRPGVRRVLCDNPSPFTFTGTVSYIVGRGKVAIVDPGPDNEAHAAALLDAVRGETVTHILVTHTHRDHSPNTARIKAATGATVYAEGPHRASRPRFESEKHSPESGADRDFKPDVAVSHGDSVEGDGWRLEAVATPGHTANHLAFAWPERKYSLCRRSRDGLVDLDRGAAGRIDDRLHGLAGPAREPRGRAVFLRPRAGNPGRTALRAVPDPASPGARSLDPASPQPRATPTFRPWCARSISASIPRLTAAAGYSVLAHLEDLVGARHRRDRGRSGDRRDVSAGAS